MKIFPTLFVSLSAIVFCVIFGIEYRSLSGDFVISEGRFMIVNVDCPETMEGEFVLRFRGLSFSKMLPLQEGGMGWGSASGLVVFAGGVIGWYIFLLMASSLIYGDRRRVSRILMLLPKNVPEKRAGPGRMNK